MRKLAMTSLLIVMLLVVTSCDLPDVDVCIPSFQFGKAYCGPYSMKDVEFIEEPIPAPLSSVDDAFCISKESWLLKLKPALLKNKRQEQDSK
jgi:hypothetical protein